MNNSQNFTITTWGPERPPVTFPASSAAEAYDIVLDKAVYEVSYELNNRPDWVIIPIRGIRHILQTAS